MSNSQNNTEQRFYKTLSRLRANVYINRIPTFYHIENIFKNILTSMTT